MRQMMIAAFAAMAVLVVGLPANAEILAMMNYESKTADSLKALKIGGASERQEGIAIVDVDPKSAAFGNIVMNIPLPTDLVAHHIFYDRTMTKAYVTALAKGELRVMDMTQNPYRMKVIDVPECKLGEDVIFSEDNSTWYLTCMASDTVVVGDVKTDTKTKVVKTAVPYPHGLAVHTGIDRVLVTNTIRHDLKEPGEMLMVYEASTMKHLASHKLSKKPSPSGEAPVEILFVPGANPPLAYVTNMFGSALWSATWDASAKKFKVAEAYNFAGIKAGVPLEMYFNDDASRMYVTTAKPGAFHIFDIKGIPGKPKLLNTIPAAEGAHHVAFTKDWSHAFVQNALLNLPGMSDGSITIIDLKAEKVIGKMDHLQKKGLNPNSIVLLPKWNHLAGH